MMIAGCMVPAARPGCPGEVGGSGPGGVGSLPSTDGYSSAKDYIKGEFKKVYHHSDQEITNFEVGREAWFTTDQYGYNRRIGSNVVNTRFINRPT